MKKLITLAILFVSIIHFNSYAQETYSRTLNVGLGVGGYAGYYKYAGRSLPVLSVNYEIGVAKNFTLAPFLSLYTFRDDYYWGNSKHPDRYYTYRETVIPIGVKGTYYFDDLLGAIPRWDFYLAGSLGLAIVSSRWENGYYGDANHYHSGNSLFLDIHIGAEYHFNSRIGAFLDLSSGVSTIGLAIHGK